MGAGRLCRAAQGASSDACKYSIEHRAVEAQLPADVPFIARYDPTLNTGQIHGLDDKGDAIPPPCWGVGSARKQRWMGRQVARREMAGRQCSSLRRPARGHRQHVALETSDRRHGSQQDCPGREGGKSRFPRAFDCSRPCKRASRARRSAAMP
jgi:hypothetical protein